MNAVLTFEEARARLAQETGQPVLPYGTGDDRYYFISLDVPRKEPLMCGEDVSTYAIDRTSGAIVMAGPSPSEVFFRSYKAPERYGDFPAQAGVEGPCG